MREVQGAVEFVGELSSYGSQRERTVFTANDVLVVSGWFVVTENAEAEIVFVELAGLPPVRAVTEITRHSALRLPNGAVLTVVGMNHSPLPWGLSPRGATQRPADDVPRLGFRAIIALRGASVGRSRISVSAHHLGTIRDIEGPDVTIIDPARIAGSGFVMLDLVRQTADPARTDCALGDRLRGHGWALDPKLLTRPHAVVVIVDERHIFEAVQGIARLDVAEFFKLSDTAPGFEADIETEVVGPGRHRIVARMLFGDQLCELESQNTTEFFVNPL